MLKDDSQLAEVETLMAQLARGPAPDKLAEVVNEHLSTGGKRLRARLALAAVEALGRPRAAGVGWAAACEILHNATLIHDDLQDGDRVRRGRPTAWVRHGVAHAINAGDLMFMLPVSAIAATPVSDTVRWALCRVLEQQAGAVIRGQANELEMTRGRHATWPDYERAIMGKTSALFEMPVQGAALVAGRSGPEAALLAQPFRELGVVFQMQDDVLDLYGDKGRDAPGADLREGKVSALVVEHLVRRPQDHDWLFRVLETPREATSQADVDAVIARFRDSGALAGVCARIQRDTRAVREADELAGERGLAALAAEISDTILAPIAHVLSD